MGWFEDELLKAFNVGKDVIEGNPQKALADAIGLAELPPGMWEMAVLLGPVQALEVLPAIWWTLVDFGAAFDILLRAMDALTFGHVEAVRKAVDTMWRPTWTVAQALEDPTRALARDQLARIEKLHSDFTQLVQAGAGDTFDTAQKDADLLYNSMVKLVGDVNATADTDYALYDTLHNVIPRVAGFEVGALDILADILFIIAATYATDGADALVATDPPAAVAIMRAFGRVIRWIDTPLIEGVAFVAAEEAIGIWEARVNLQLRDHPQGEAIVEQDVVKGVPGSVVDVTPEYLKQELGADVYQTLHNCGASDQEIQQWYNELKDWVIGYAQKHPNNACIIIGDMYKVETRLMNIKDPGHAYSISITEGDLLLNDGLLYPGALWQIQWAANDPNYSSQVAYVEDVAGGRRVADAILKDGTVVECKSFNWSSQRYQACSQQEEQLKNWEGDIQDTLTYYSSDSRVKHPVKMVFAFNGQYGAIPSWVFNGCMKRDGTVVPGLIQRASDLGVSLVIEQPPYSPPATQ